MVGADPRDRVHPTARAFDRAAGAYERARPEYPADAVRRLGEHLGWGPDSVVLDLAAGTGKLTRSIRAVLPVRLVAVEPSPGMRRGFLDAVPGVPVLDGTAERVPLADGVLDGVVVGQAFHWFDPARSVAEIARVLRPGGGLGLLWNRRDERVPWVRSFGEIVKEYDADRAPSIRDTGWTSEFERSERFEPLSTEEHAWTHRIPAEALPDRALSVSYVAQRSADEQARIAERIRGLVAREPELAGRAEIDVPYVTQVYWTRRVPNVVPSG